MLLSSMLELLSIAHRATPIPEEALSTTTQRGNDMSNITMGGKQVALAIGEIVDRMRGGMVRVEADEELRRCVERTQETGKASKLTVTLTITAAGPANREINIAAAIKASVPQRLGVNDPSTFFGERGRVYAEDPQAAREVANAMAKAAMGEE